VAPELAAGGEIERAHHLVLALAAVDEDAVAGDHR
jgi:hypothetical protein